jgi:DNA (cytosine-5)-methyltransferase 1
MNRGGALTFYEFFAGGGMARAGLGARWRCLFANDIDPGKARAYRANWGDDDLAEADVWTLEADNLPGVADLAWASSPCQDFSLAGARAGLAGGRSSAFFGFWRLIEQLDYQGRSPRAVVLENVGGLLTAGGGEDFVQVCAALNGRGYRFGAVEIDAAAFLPQSRSRVFVIGAKELAGPLAGDHPTAFHTPAVRQAFDRLPQDLKDGWLWWRLAAPPARNASLADLLEPDEAVAWRSAAQTEALLGLMNAAHRRALAEAGAQGGRVVGAVFRRMRQEDGRKVQRAELRLDGLAGCLRTPGGGSSRQLIVVCDNGRIRTRLLTAREAARLMGLPDDYRLPSGETAGLHLVGDGVAPPVVRHLAERLLEPLLERLSVLDPAIAAAE